MVSWLLSIVVYTASRTKNFNRAELEALVESAKQFAVIRAWYICSKWYPFPTSDILGNSQYVKFESAMSEHIWLLKSISNPSKCNWLCNQLWSPKMNLAVMQIILGLHSWLHSLQECHAHAERVTMSRSKKLKGADTLCIHEVAFYSTNRSYSFVNYSGKILTASKWPWMISWKLLIRWNLHLMMPSALLSCSGSSAIPILLQLLFWAQFCVDSQ